MKTLDQLGAAVAARRQAKQAGVTPESLSRFERGRSAEFGSRKLLAVLAVLDMEVTFSEVGLSGSLDELRRERART
jgi:HTH-type transcriptional regulator / antitoxin HipB